MEQINYALGKAKQAIDKKTASNLDQTAAASYNKCNESGGFCGKDTNCFYKEWKYMGNSGNRTGGCGSMKDHSRYYCCETCHNKHNH